jgi:DnaJ family protein A protein 2
MIGCRCKKCRGKKVVTEKKRVEFRVEPGTEDGERIALRGEADQAVRLIILDPRAFH